MMNAVFREWEFEIMEEYLYMQDHSPISTFYRDNVTRYRHYYEHIYPHPNYIIVYLEDFARQGNGGFRLLLDFFTISDYIRFNEEFETENRNENGIPKTTFFYLENYQPKDSLVKGAHYYLDIRTLKSLIVELKPDDGEGFPVLYSISIPLNEGQTENNKATLLYQTQSLTYPQWVFGSLHNTNNPISISGSSNAELMVWDVNQGNFNEVKVDDQPYVIFDAGTEVLNVAVPFQPLQHKLTVELQQANVPMFVLSHWHTDHYSLLFAQSNNDLLRIAYYVLPSYVKSLSVFCFIARLQQIGACINMVVLPFSNPWVKYVINTSLTLYANKYVTSSVNNSGLTLFVQGPTNNAMLPGDGRYKIAEAQTKDSILLPMTASQMHYLVIPHHGGDAGTVSYVIPNARSIEGVVSVGANNRHRHPNVAVIGKLGRFLQPNIEMTMTHGDIVKVL